MGTVKGRRKKTRRFGSLLNTLMPRYQNSALSRQSFDICSYELFLLGVILTGRDSWKRSKGRTSNYHYPPGLL